MKELLKDIFYLGAGAAFMTKEKFEELKKELIEKGKLSQDEGRQIVDELMKRAEDIRNDMEKKVKETVTEQMKKLNVASREELEELRTEIEKIKAERKSKDKTE